MRSTDAPSSHRRGAAAARTLATLLLVAVIGAACSSDDDGGAAPAALSGELTVSAAASLTGAFTELGTAFEAAHPGTTISFNFDSSGALATQIESGAPADVFASADSSTMARLADAGLLAGDPVVFARNRLAIVVKPGNPEDIGSLADLAAAGVVALCADTAPCGKYADQVLAEAGVDLPDDRITRGQNAKATLTAVASGDADAGIVYVTDALASTDVERVDLAESDNAVADYPIGIVRSTAATDLADAFVEYVTGPDARRVLESAGFLAP